MKTIYQMSSAGACPRVLAAKQLNYQAMPQTVSDEERLSHYTALEKVAADQISALGLKLEDGGYCSKCKRHGIHVEIDTSLFLLVGHLDRRVTINGTKYPVEIKSLGKTSYTRFERKQFSAFMGYAGQEACYLEAEQKPGVYWIMERDSGARLHYAVNDPTDMINMDYKKKFFNQISLPITFNDIVDKLNMIEIFIQDGTLPEGEENDDCFFCDYKFLCSKPETKAVVKVETLPALIEAANMYREGLQKESEGKALKSDGKDILLEHSKTNSIEKYKVAGVSFTYSGTRTKETINKKLIMENLEDLVKKYKLPKTIPNEIIKVSTKISEPFDDYDIRVLKE